MNLFEKVLDSSNKWEDEVSDNKTNYILTTNNMDSLNENYKMKTNINPNRTPINWT